ncbi:Hypothetical predicted protein [Olea europaea subsp. europaea]|uniref:Uncharacterized protein n=1 Tax=Olea europaea subsp. europaea TaxID=158383 RepID=A0A8S0VEY8_OLEEU|nr:Hypothetical predicted protein [Olea europaea subsp. europaea]
MAPKSKASAVPVRLHLSNAVSQQLAVDSGWELQSRSRRLRVGVATGEKQERVDRSGETQFKFKQGFGFDLNEIELIESRFRVWVSKWVMGCGQLGFLD